ncbi:hypothetical protein CapIbe_007089 [Capra ibex]
MSFPQGSVMTLVTLEAICSSDKPPRWKKDGIIAWKGVTGLMLSPVSVSAPVFTFVKFESVHTKGKGSHEEPVPSGVEQSLLEAFPKL